MGCHANENVEQENTESQIKVMDEIAMQAEKEGVSVKEMQKTIDGLIALEAKKYGISEEEYIEQVEADGNTVLSEWQTTSEYMGISITELYEYEKTNVNSLTEEELATLSGMSDALEMAKEEMEDMPSVGETAVGNMLGIEENSTGEIRTVSMTDEELKEAFNFEVYLVTQDYTDEYSTIFDYTSDGDIEDLVNHYEELLYNTEGYMKIQPLDSETAMIQGKISGVDIYIEIDNSQGGMPTVATYIDLTSKE
jgi:hypothetical protein